MRIKNPIQAKHTGEDKVDAIIKRRLKPKPHYYISTLFIKISILILLLLFVLESFEIV